MDKKKYHIIFLIVILTVLFTTILSLCLGAVWISPKELISSIFSKDLTISKRIFLYARLPRTMGCLLAGAGLATAGGLIQGVFANKLASPGIIGVNAGAGLGVTISCTFAFASGWSIAGAAFLGALLAVLTITLAASATGASRSSVILGGVALNSLLTAFSEGINTLFPENGAITMDFRVGGFSGVSTVRLIPAAIIIIIALIITFSLSNELDLLSMGEDTAQGLGLNVKAIRGLFLIIAALLAGASVSFAGLLGFVGLIIPNIVRKIVGSESKKLLPMCAAVGAIFVTLCDCIARTAFSPHEIPTGIVMSIIGAPFFLFLLFKSKGGHFRG